MRFATLVALAVVVSSTPGLAAPAPFAPNRANSGPHRDHAHPDHAHARAVTADHPSHPAHSGSHHAHPEHAAHARAVHPDHPGPHHAFPDHEAHARAVTSDRHPGPHHNHPGHAGHARAVTSDILQVIESAFDSLPLARKRDVVTSVFQELLQAATPLSSSLLDNLKRDLSSDDYQGLLESLGLSGSGSTIDKRLKLPEISPSTESAISNAANVATIGGSIAKIWDAIDGSSSSSKRDETQIDERAFKIPASVTTWLKTIGNVGSIGAGGAAIFGAVDGGSDSTMKREFIEADERALKIPAEVTTWLKTLGNVGSIGAGGAAIVGALDGGSNSTLKRELDDEVDLATLLNGVSQKFEDRSVSSSEVSGLESVLGKVATAASVGGTLATVWSALDPSSSSTTSKRGFNLTEELQNLKNIGFEQDEPILVPSIPTALDTNLVSERSIVSSAEGILAQLLGGILGGSGGISIKRATTDGGFDITDFLSPEEIQQVVAHMNARMVDLD